MNSDLMLKSVFTEDKCEAGVDEVGRGSLVGIVVAAAVILPKDYKNDQIKDSKKLNEKQRNALQKEIEREAIAWAIGLADHAEIDAINILQASYLAMHRAIEKLEPQPELLLVDGNRFKKFKDLEHHCFVKGDNLFLFIAAASILAKCYRDTWIIELSDKYPEYHWHKNKGYATKDHIKAIEQYGLSEYHRKSFQLKSSQQSLNFEK
jgi:ribonuclease HII